MCSFSGFQGFTTVSAHARLMTVGVNVVEAALVMASTTSKWQSFMFLLLLMPMSSVAMDSSSRSERLKGWKSPTFHC